MVALLSLELYTGLYPMATKSHQRVLGKRDYGEVRRLDSEEYFLAAASRTHWRGHGRVLEDAVTTRAGDGEILDGDGSSRVGRGNQSEGVQLIIPGTMVMRNGDYVSGMVLSF